MKTTQNGVYQAIQTKFLPCTNSRGSRIKAWCDRGSVTVPFSHSGKEHREAAEALCAKFIAEDKAKYGDQAKSAWDGLLIEGGLPNNGGHCFVFVPREMLSQLS